MERIAPQNRNQKSIQVFCCYAHQDQPLFDEIKKHLMPLTRKGLITLWADTDIQAGAEREKEIQIHLNAASIILLFVSPDFMASDYCYRIGMHAALERQAHSKVCIVPIILRPTSWQITPLGKFPAMQRDGIPLTTWENRDEAFHDVSERLRDIVANLVEEESHRLYEKDRISTIETQVSSQEIQPISLSHTFMNTSLRATPLPVISITPFDFTKIITRVIRIIAFFIILTLYWLLAGYLISDIFPKKILRISGSTHIYMFLRGDYRKAESLKIFIVFFSLILDWLTAGIILSSIPHPNLFISSDAFLYGPILVGIFACLSIGYIILCYIIKWHYINVINIRKTIEIIVVVILLTFISSSFGSSFLYFPLLTGVTSLCLFIYGLIGLGGTQQRSGAEILNEKLEKRFQDRLEDERLSQEYFSRRNKR